MKDSWGCTIGLFFLIKSNASTAFIPFITIRYAITIETDLDLPAKLISYLPVDEHIPFRRKALLNEGYALIHMAQYILCRAINRVYAQVCEVLVSSVP